MKAAQGASFLAAGVMAVALIAGVGLHNTAIAAPHGALGNAPARVNMVIVPGIRLGADHKMHDAFTPTDFTALAGQTIVVTVYNYDEGTHSFTAPALGLNAIIPAAKTNGVPAVKTFSFTVAKAGAYRWLCVMPCDDVAKGWAMRHQDYMAGTVTIQQA